MHQYRTVSRILLIFSIFNVVHAAPVVRDIYDAREDVPVPKVAVMSKERHQSRSDDATTLGSSPPPPPPPDESTTPSSSLPPLPDGLTTSHSSPQLSDGPHLREGDFHEWSPTSFHEWSPTPLDVPPLLYSSSHSDGEGTLQELPPPGEIVPVGPPPVANPPLSAEDEASIRHLRSIIEMRQAARTFVKKVAISTVTLAVTAGIVLYYRHRKHRHRAIDPDWYVINPSHPSYRCPNFSNHKTF